MLFELIGSRYERPLIPFPNQSELAVMVFPLSDYRVSGLYSIQTDLGSVSLLIAPNQPFGESGKVFLDQAMTSPPSTASCITPPSWR